MIQEVKILLGDSKDNYSDELIELVCKQAISFCEMYTGSTLDAELEIIAQRVAVINLNRINTEGLASQSHSGVSESYLSDLPADIISALKGKRKLMVF